MKISIIYHSVSGNTAKVAQKIAEGANLEGVEVQTMDIEAIDEEFLFASRAVVVGCPTYMATFSWQMKKWLDTTYVKGELAGKLAGVFATANFFGGGAEIAELGLVAQLMFKGMLLYSAGNTVGPPNTHLGAVARKSGDDFESERAKIFGQRIAKKAMELFG